MSLYELFTSNGPNGFGYGSTAEDVTVGISLAGKAFLLTGCNSGIGKETLRVLTLRGAQVVATARTIEKARETCDAVGGQTIPLECDLTNPASIRQCVSAIKTAGIKLDSIICNAGIMALPNLVLNHGYESQFFTNHIGHFILVTELIDHLTSTGRVVLVSSTAHKRAAIGGIEFDNLDGSKSYDPWRQYGQSKFANILFAKELARRFFGTQRTANAVHPGVISTNLDRNNVSARLYYKTIGIFFNKSIPQGAATQVYVATNPALATTTGQYFADCNIAVPRADTDNLAVAIKLWDISEKIANQI